MTKMSLKARRHSPRHQNLTHFQTQPTNPFSDNFPWSHENDEKEGELQPMLERHLVSREGAILAVPTRWPDRPPVSIGNWTDIGFKTQEVAHFQPANLWHTVNFAGVPFKSISAQQIWLSPRVLQCSSLEVTPPSTIPIPYFWGHKAL